MFGRWNAGNCYAFAFGRHAHLHPLRGTTCLPPYTVILSLQSAIDLGLSWGFPAQIWGVWQRSSQCHLYRCGVTVMQSTRLQCHWLWSVFSGCHEMHTWITRMIAAAFVVTCVCTDHEMKSFLECCFLCVFKEILPETSGLQESHSTLPLVPGDRRALETGQTAHTCPAWQTSGKGC